MLQSELLSQVVKELDDHVSEREASGEILGKGFEEDLAQVKQLLEEERLEMERTEESMVGN